MTLEQQIYKLRSIASDAMHAAELYQDAVRDKTDPDECEDGDDCGCCPSCLLDRAHNDNLALMREMAKGEQS